MHYVAKAVTRQLAHTPELRDVARYAVVECVSAA